ncbi:ABC transporter ATP-binding protein [Catellatospora sp. KI3]|uniref:ABC transporter ATP-binding protein n=1 Tax=Catellatospora sp. KI3 TaxID=3041620 RepID=UPI00248324E3|nr:ABC transporter ATP-binding protein [Catellatospora sp. KI3]MDI1465176.1 ABC transporter ATP-binding protein [Catellatospora sp. KI3]
MTELIRLRDVAKAYEAAGPPALAGVDLTVRAGEAVAVMGPSGSGKSTLLNVIAGLDRPTGGSVEVAGVRVDKLSETALARFRSANVGIIFQFFHLLDEMTVRDNVLLPARLAGVRTAPARTRADELLARLGIADKCDQYPARLSGGQRQRVAIARALMNRPQLLLADEPTGAVDQEAAAGVRDLLHELSADGLTLLLVTHDPQLATTAGRRLITMRDGRATEAVPA